MYRQSKHYQASVCVTVSKAGKNVAQICDIMEPVYESFGHTRELLDLVCGLKRFELFASNVYELRNVQLHGDKPHVLLWVNACAAIMNEAALEARLLLCYNCNLIQAEKFEELVRWIVSYGMDIADSLNLLGLTVLLSPPKNVDPISPTKLGRSMDYRRFIPIYAEKNCIEESVSTWNSLLSKMLEGKYAQDLRHNLQSA